LHESLTRHTKRAEKETLSQAQFKMSNYSLCSSSTARKPQ